MSLQLQQYSIDDTRADIPSSKFSTQRKSSKRKSRKHSANDINPSLKQIINKESTAPFIKKAIEKFPQRFKRINPETLLKAGILRDINTTKNAIKRAEQHIEREEFQTALEVLKPFRFQNQVQHITKLSFLFGQIYKHIGGPWYEKFKLSFKYEKSPYQRIIIFVSLAEGFIIRGSFNRAKKFIGKAYQEFKKHPFSEKEEEHIKLVLQLKVLKIKQRELKIIFVLSEIQKLITNIKQSPLSEKKIGQLEFEASEILGKALLFTGALKLTNKIMISAAKKNFVINNIHARYPLNLIQFESHIHKGESEKIIPQLKKVLNKFTKSSCETLLENPHIKAQANFIMGKALFETKPEMARQYFTRSRHIYGNLLNTHAYIKITIYLATVEKYLNLPIKKTLKTIPKRAYKKWPTHQHIKTLLLAPCALLKNPNAKKSIEKSLQDVIGFSYQQGITLWLVHTYKILKDFEMIPSDKKFDYQQQKLKSLIYKIEKNWLNNHSQHTFDLNHLESSFTVYNVPKKSNKNEKMQAFNQRLNLSVS